MDTHGLDMSPYTPSKVVEVPAGGTKEITFQGPSSRAFGITRMHASAESPGQLKMTFGRQSDDTTHWRDVLVQAIQRYFAGHELRVPLLLPRSEKAVVTLEDTSGSAQTVGVQLEGLHSDPLKRRQEDLGLSAKHRELTWFYGTETVSSGASLSDIGVNYEKSRERAFDRFTVASNGNAPHDLQARLVTGNSPIRLLATFEQITRAFENGKRAPAPYETEPYNVFSVEVSNNDSSQHEVSFLAASLPPSFY